MDLAEHRRYSQRLQSLLEGRGDVIGLVALGSMAEQGELPDAYSDHDFFVIVEAASAETYRDRDDWLPDREWIRLRFRETAHGAKAIYESGHLVEYAVFTPDELALARVNRYRVLFDRGDVIARMHTLAIESRSRAEREAPDDAWLLGQLIAETLVAALRGTRGEHLSASQRRQAATRHLLGLVARHVPSAHPERLDSLDVTRRFELAFPDIARRLHEAERASASEHLLCLLAVAESELAPRLPGFPRAAIDAVRRRVLESS